MARIVVEEKYFCEVKNCYGQIDKDKKYCYGHRFTDCKHIIKEKIDIGNYFYHWQIKKYIFCSVCKKDFKFYILEFSESDFDNYILKDINMFLDLFKKIRLNKGEKLKVIEEDIKKFNDLKPENYVNK